MSSNQNASKSGQSSSINTNLKAVDASSGTSLAADASEKEVNTEQRMIARRTNNSFAEMTRYDELFSSKLNANNYASPLASQFQNEMKLVRATRAALAVAFLAVTSIRKKRDDLSVKCDELFRTVKRAVGLYGIDIARVLAQAGQSTVLMNHGTVVFRAEAYAKICGVILHGSPAAPDELRKRVRELIKQATVLAELATETDTASRAELKARGAARDAIESANKTRWMVENEIRLADFRAGTERARDLIPPKPRRVISSVAEAPPMDSSGDNG